jgi:hypothetical protein
LFELPKKETAARISIFLLLVRFHSLLRRFPENRPIDIEIKPVLGLS